MSRGPQAALAWLSRLGAALVVLAGASTLAFLLLWSSPGDPIDLLSPSDEVRAELERQWRYDRPLPERILGAWIDRLSGDWGRSVSHRPGTPVPELVLGPLGRSAGWLAGGWGLAMVGGGLLGGLAATGRSRWLRLARPVSAVPVLVMAHMLVAGLNAATWEAIQRDWIARPDWFALPLEPSFLRSALAVGVLAVGSGTLAEIAHETREALMRVLGSGWVEASRARGEPIVGRVARHLTLALARIGARRVGPLVGGLVILEKVLLLDGAGALLWRCAELRDYDVATALTIAAATAVVAGRLAAELTTLALDPRAAEGR